MDLRRRYLRALTYNYEQAVCVLRVQAATVLFGMVHHPAYYSPQLDIGLSISLSRQPSCANQSTWLEGVLHYVYRDVVSTPELVYTSGCRFYG
jgi:hypothetical protein